MKNTKHILKEGEEEQPRKFSNEVKKHFLEIVSTYNKYQEAMDRKSDLTQIAETLGGIVEAAQQLAVNEADDWFDKHTVKRNMSELSKLGKEFDKFAVEAKSLDQRLSGLYEDMGHILSRYYKLGDINEEEMKSRLGITESIQTADKFMKALNMMNEVAATLWDANNPKSKAFGKALNAIETLINRRELINLKESTDSKIYYLVVNNSTGKKEVKSAPKNANKTLTGSERFSTRELADIAAAKANKQSIKESDIERYVALAVASRNGEHPVGFSIFVKAKGYPVKELPKLYKTKGEADSALKKMGVNESKKSKLSESAMSTIDIIRQESSDLKTFIKDVLKEFPELPKNKLTLKYLKDLYTQNESITEVTVSQIAKKDADHMDRNLNGKSEKEVRKFVDSVYHFKEKDVRNFMVSTFMSYQNGKISKKTLDTLFSDFYNRIYTKLESINEAYGGPMIVKTGNKYAFKIGEKVTVDVDGKKREYKVVKSNGNGDFVCHLVESITEALNEYDEWKNTKIQAKNIFRMLRQKYNNVPDMKKGLEDILKQNKTKPDQENVMWQEFNDFFKIKESKKSIKENFTPQDIEMIKKVVDKEKKLIGLSKIFDKMGWHTDFIMMDSIPPHLRLKKKKGDKQTYLLINKRYVDKPDWVSGEIAGGLDESVEKKNLIVKEYKDDSLKPGMKLKSKEYGEDIILTLVEPTEKGWKVKELSKTTMSGQKIRNPKEKIKFYPLVYLKGDRRGFVPLNESSFSNKSDEINQFLDKLRKNQDIIRMAIFYERPIDDIVKLLKTKLKVFRYNSGTPKKITLDFIDKGTNLHIKQSEIFSKNESVNEEDLIPGGLAKGKTLEDIANKHNVDIDELVAQFKKGIAVEMEHTTDVNVAKEISLDHLFENPKYYDELAKIENVNESNVSKSIYKKVGGKEMAFYDELEILQNKLGYPKYMIWLANELKSVGVDIDNDRRIKNKAEAEETLYNLSK